MPSVQTVIYDPKFRALDPEVQRGVLARIDPRYAALGDDDQKEALSRLLAPPAMPSPTVKMRGGPYVAGPGEQARIEGPEKTADARRKSAEGLYELGHGFQPPPPDWQPPASPEEARKGLTKATRDYAGVELGLYSMGIPGPGKAASLPLQIAKGAAIGGGTSAGLYAANRGIHGELPDISGTAIAFGTGATIGAIAESFLQVPGVRRAIARIPKLKEFMAPSKAEEFDAQMEQKAQDLMRRGKEQEAMDLKQAMAARRATRAAQQEAKTQAEAVESAKFKPSPGVKRSMGPSGTPAYSPEETAPYRPGTSPPARPRVTAPEPEPEFKPFKPSEGVKRSMGPSGTRAYSPEETAPYRPGAKPPARPEIAPPEPEFKPFKPSEGVRRSMGKSSTSYDPQADAGFSAGGRPRAKGLPAPPRPAGEEGAEAVHAGGSGVRPSASEARITMLIRKPVLTPDEAAELERALGPRWKLMRGQGLMEHQAETLGLVRARRAAQGMPEPH